MEATTVREAMTLEARSALHDVYAILRTIGQGKADPGVHPESADVGSPQGLTSQERKADEMNSTMDQPPALDAARSDRTLGAQSRPGTAAVKGATP